MRRIQFTFFSVGVVLLLGMAAPALGDEKAQKGQATSMDDMMKSCREHHSSEMKAQDEAMAALARAKQANSMDEMRKGIEQAEKSLGQMNDHMSKCMGMMDKMGGMHGKMTGSGMMSGGMMSGEKKAAAKVTDPVCGMEVDPTNAPSASYNGKTYSFCSPEDKAKFEKNPETYIKKKPA